MTETNPEQPVIVSAAVSNEPKKPQIDINRLFLPVAILLAGLAIGGAIIYVNKGNLGAKEAQASILVADNLKKWGKKAGGTIAQFNSCLDKQEFKTEIEKDLQEGTAAGVKGTPSFFVNGTFIEGAQPYTTFQVAIEAALKGVRGSATVSADDDPVLGNADAPVTIIEFSDFECPYCRKFWQDTFSKIKSDYIDTGKVKFVYRDFPITNLHPGAMPAALAAECADQQGKFWEMHDLIFQSQI